MNPSSIPSFSTGTRRRTQVILAYTFALAVVLFARVPGAPSTVTGPMSFAANVSWVAAVFFVAAIRIGLLIGLLFDAFQRGQRALRE